MKFVFVIFSLNFYSILGFGGLKLVLNGYEGLIVGISDQVPQDHCNSVIHGLKIVMSKFSSLMHQMTHGRASLREVTVALPRHWRTNDVTCSLLEPIEAAPPPIKHHISISVPHPVFGSEPWTRQSQSCGKPGDFIQLGADMLRSVSNDSHYETAAKLFAEWMKFRWGVFDENGHEGDSLYPPYFRDPSTNELVPNKCQNALDENFKFCDKQDHITESPNKHNVMCKGQSVWDIIEESEDFANKIGSPSNRTSFYEPIYHYVQESSPRFVIVVEDTAVMNMQRRWKFVRKAVRRVIVYDIPDETFLSVVVFNSVAHSSIPLSKVDSISDVRQRIGSSLPRNPSTVPESHKCLLCGLQEAIRILNSDSIGSAGANIILITSGTSSANHHQMDEMIRIIKSSKVRVIPILYPLTENPGTMNSLASKNLIPLVQASGDGNGPLFTVVDEGVGNDSKVSMMIALMDALLAALSIPNSNTANSSPIVVHSQAYPGGISSMSSGSFNIDESLSDSIRFSIYYYDLSHVGNVIQLIAPSGTALTSINIQEDGDANVIFVNISNAERGIWKYKVENRADSHQGLHLQVTAFENPNRKLSVNFWTNMNGEQLEITKHFPPVILYAEVKDGGSPVLGAKVTVKLHKLGKNATRYPYQPYYVDLLDNGIGDPDMMKGDGVYSRYLPSYMYTMPGQYALSISANNNNNLAQKPLKDDPFRSSIYSDTTEDFCCGNTLRYKHLQPVDKFFREISYGVVSIHSDITDKDISPPSRILDLRAELIDGNNVQLRWTSPGNDYDWGFAHHYEAIVASSHENAEIYEGINVTSLPVPKPYGHEQSFTIHIYRYDQINYVSIRAVDEFGNKGDVSNIVNVWIPSPPTTKQPMTTPNSANPSRSSRPYGDHLTQTMGFAGLTVEKIAIIGGVIGGVLIIVSVLTTLCLCHISKRKKMQRQDEESVASNKNVIIKTNQGIILAQEDSRDSSDSTVKESGHGNDVRSLSPVQSWPASKLLAEHEKRFSVTGGEIIDHRVVETYDSNMRDQFPDVTLTGLALSYASSQATTTQSDPPAYQPHFVSEGYSYDLTAYPPPGIFNHEDLPPYTPGILSYPQMPSFGKSHSEGAYANQIIADMHPAYICDPNTMPVLYANAPPPESFSNTSIQILRPPLAAKKVPPPVAPKPNLEGEINNSPLHNGSPPEPKRRNVTQV